MTTLNTEFAAGSGVGVIVDQRRRDNLVHVDPACKAIGKRTTRYPSERIARAAVPSVKPCKTCRP